MQNTKSEIQNPKQIAKPNDQAQKRFDLEDRTFDFARNCRELVRLIPKDIAGIEDGKQLVRSSGSVAANYIEANEALSKKDFIMRIKICRKEAKESWLWLRLVKKSKATELLTIKLTKESEELTNIFGAIVRKSEK